MEANDPPGCGQLGPQGHDWQDLCRVPLIIATHKICKSSGPHGLREEDFFFHIFLSYDYGR